ncbi:MAG TPA: MotA/TolQ/ExbB proton channel family protein [Sphingomicrobium sp.]|nr:MotA/TolQ/ExbB proton channel family protein [Sphingomicrobium sp.]
MAILQLTAAAAAAPAGENPYGLLPALQQGGIIAWSVFVILVGMSIFSFYILFTKLMQQQKIIAQGRKVRASFWNSTNLREAAGKLDEKSAYRSIVDDTLLAQEQHGKLTDPIDQHDWMANSLARSQGAIGARLGEGLAFLATVGSTAPFIGLFGTVIGIYRALIKIGASGQASIDTVAGPVGEALIMTALGLVVAVPAVLAYNWLIRRNKSIMEDLAAFTNDLHGYVMSGGSVRPRFGPEKAATGSRTGAPTATAGNPGGARQPLRTGATQTGAETPTS